MTNRPPYVMVLLFCGLAVLAARPSYAQRGQTSTLSGVVRDATNHPLSDVSVTIGGSHLIGGAQTVSSDEAGRYRFTALPPGNYIITLHRTGFQTLRRSGIDLFPGYALTMDLVLHVSTVEITVDVNAVSSAVDVRSSASVQIIERPLLEHLPLESRAITSHINLAPGINGSIALGGAALANPVSIDGTSGTSPVQGTPEAAPTIYWLDALQVISTGADAEYGEYSTARLNAITRSGSNRFSGLAEHVQTRRTWARWNELLAWRNTFAQLGGPIRRDRLWFFAGLERYDTRSRVTAFANQPRTAEEPLVETFEQKHLLKLTGVPASPARLEGFVSHVRGKSLNGNANAFVRPEALGSFDSGQRMANVRFTWPATSRLLVEAHYGGFRAHNGQGPTDLSRRSGPPPHRDQATGVFSVNYPQLIDAVRTVRSSQLALTRYVADSPTGEHEIRAGVEHERASVREDIGYPGNTFYLDRNGRPELVRFWEGSHFRPSHDRTTVFVRDNWRLGRLTLEPGLRISRYDSSVQNPATDTYSNHSIAPRIGAAWDVSADHRTVLRAHYGHYNDPMATRFYEFLDLGADTTFIVARVLGDDQFEEVSRTGGPTNVPVIDPQTKHSYAEEWFAGVEREILPRVSVKAQYVRRNTRNTIGFIDEGSTWRPLPVTDPGADGRQGTTDDGDVLTVYINEQSTPARFVMTNPDGAWRQYDGVQLVGTRRAADGWSVQASYAWGRTVGSFDNENGSNAANTDLATNGNFANPNRAINTTGRTVFDRRHDGRVFGTYRFRYWGGFRVSGIYRYTSGLPWGRIVNSFDPRTQAAVLVEPIGTRHLPPTSELDVRVEKTLRFPGSVTAGIFADVFNATNREVASRSQQVSGSAFGNVTGWTQPRRFRLGLRATF